MREGKHGRNRINPCWLQACWSVGMSVIKHSGKKFWKTIKKNKTKKTWHKSKKCCEIKSRRRVRGFPSAASVPVLLYKMLNRNVSGFVYGYCQLENAFGFGSRSSLLWQGEWWMPSPPGAENTEEILWHFRSTNLQVDETFLIGNILNKPRVEWTRLKDKKPHDCLKSKSCHRNSKWKKTKILQYG